MRFGQDLCIALVLAVIGAGFGRPAPVRSQADEGFAVIEEAMAGSGLSDEDAASVRRLINAARERERAGDEDGAVSAMAAASAILKIA